MAAIRAVCAYPLPERGAAELHFAAASKGAEAYGLFLAGQTLSICRKANQIRLLDADGAMRWEMALPEDFRHDALHCVTFRWDGAFSAYLDHLLLRGLTLHLSGAHVGYFADGAARFGSVTISGVTDLLCVPTADACPGDLGVFACRSLPMAHTCVHFTDKALHRRGCTSMAKKSCRSAKQEILRPSA